jgi:hypothetical protein
LITRLLTIAFLLVAAAASAQEPPPASLPGNCGGFNTDLDVLEHGGTAARPRVVMTAKTSVDISICLLTANVAAVLGDPYTTVWKDDTRAPVAQAIDYRDTGFNSTWDALSRHKLYFMNFNHDWVDLGWRFDRVTTRDKPRAEEITESGDCWYLGYVWMNQYGDCVDNYSPIVIDVARNGIRLTSIARGVAFDLSGDGPQQWSWTRRNSDDAWLALDRDGNGTIDSGRELFGNRTPVAQAEEEFGAGTWPANGFEALKSLDADRNHWVDVADPAYARLLLWTDRNHNGFSEPQELQTAASAGLVAISTDYKESQRVDRHGNQFRQRGRVVFSDGGHDFAWDVWLIGREDDAEDDQTNP